MMELPKDGKVVIVDDCRTEIEPLIDVLSKKRIPHLFYSGMLDGLPEKPLTGVRLVFLDLRFGPSIDVKTNVGNACAVLNRIICEDNGPFLLITWSSTGDDYIPNLKDALDGSGIVPEKIIPLSKADYFTTVPVNIDSTITELKSIILESADLDTVEENRLMSKIKNYLYSGVDESKRTFIREKFDALGEAINAAIQSAGVLPLFVVWENAIQNAASTTVTNIYRAVPSTVTPQKRLMAVANSLAHNVLEQQYDQATAEERLQAAFQELGDVFAYFYEEETCDLEKKISVELKGGNESDLKEYYAKLNSWKLIRSAGKAEAPGRVYNDVNRLFDWKSFAKKGDVSDKEYEKMPSEDVMEKNIVYIYMNINGECETAQKKAKYMKIVPGIIVEKGLFSSIYTVNDLKKRDDLMIFGSFDYEGCESYIVFSLDQCMSIDLDRNNEQSLFLLNRKYYLQVRQKIASNYSKQGSDLYE